MKEQILEQRILIAEDGHYLTNGDTFGKVVTLPIGADASVWSEITEAEKEAIEAERDAESTPPEM